MLKRCVLISLSRRLICGYKYLFCYNCTKYNLESVELKHILGNRDINVFPDLNPLLILILN